MKSLVLNRSVRLLVLAPVLVLAACMIKGSGGKLSPPPVLPQMGGSWDFTVTGGNGNPVGLEAVLLESTPGNLSANVVLSAKGGPGQITNGAVFELDISGSSLATASDMAIDYIGNTCGSDNGNRTLAGMIDASGHVTLTYNIGGSSTVAISGTFNASATPPFSGSFTVSAPGCKSNGQMGTITGVLASSHTGTYSGTSASDSTETITMILTETDNLPPGFCCATLSGTGTDSKNGNFSFDGGTLGNFLEGNVSGPGSPNSNGPVFGYFDPQLGPKGSILLTSFQGGTATSCPNGVPIDNGSCLIAKLTLQ